MENPVENSAVKPRVLVGGVGYRWQRDASFGMLAIDHMQQMNWPEHVEVADLGYGAIYVFQDLASASPPYQKLLLLAGMQRDRPPGRFYAYRFQPTPLPDDELQARIFESGAGVVDLDHLLAIANYFKALPEEVWVLEMEPVDVEGGEGLSPQAQALLPQAVEWVRRQVMAESEPEAFLE